MTGRGSNTFAGRAFGPDPLDDPLVTGWDAVIGRDVGAPHNGDSDDVLLVRRFLALDTVPLPSPGFFDDLERTLATVSPSPVEPRQLRYPSNSALVKSAPPVAPAPRLIPKPQRWTTMHSALAVLAAMLVVSLLVLYQAVPGPSEPPPIPAAVIAKPSMETITQFEFVPPMWDMADATAWDYMEIGLFEVAPATSFSTDVGFYTSVVGPLALTVLRGEVNVTPAGPALFYPASQTGQPAREISAGETVAVGPNETIVYAATDGATGNNQGTVSALTMYGTVGPLGDEILGTVPNDVSFLTSEIANPMTSLPTKGATVTLQRLELAPFDTFVFEPDADLRYLPFFDPAQVGELHMDEGAIEGVVPQSGAQRIYGPVSLRYLNPGPHTIFNLGDQMVSIYFLVVEPLPDGGVPPA